MKQTYPSEIEKIFYEDFTKRQNDSVNLLIKLLALLGAVILGYGYVLFEINISKQEPITVFFMLVFVEILLIIYFKIIYDSGFAFRRDQIVVYRILRKYDLIKENENDSTDFKKVFIKHYNPLKKHQNYNGKLIKKNDYKHVLFLLPAFHNTLSTAIFAIHFILYLSFVIKLSNITKDEILIGNIGIKYPYILVCMFFTTCIIFLTTIQRKNKSLKLLYKEELEQTEEQTSESVN